MAKKNGYSECENKAYTTPDEIKKQFASYLYNRECNEVTGQWTCPKCPFNKECDQNIERGDAGVELCETILGPEVTAGPEAYSRALGGPQEEPQWYLLYRKYHR